MITLLSLAIFALVIWLTYRTGRRDEAIARDNDLALLEELDRLERENPYD